MNFDPSWWMWVAGGLALMMGELLTPGGFYLFFFGDAAVVVGLLKWAGLSGGFAWDGLLFTVLSLAGCVLFRRPLMQRFSRLTPQTVVDSLAGQEAVAIEEMSPGGRGKAELRGTAWSAENVGAVSILKSARCRVERVEGLTLFVRGL
jgi:inner membrane protein